MSIVTRSRAWAVLPLALVLAQLNVAAGQTGRGRGRYVPPDGKVLVLVGSGWGDQVESYTKATGHVPAGVNIFWLFTDDTTFYRECEKNAPAGAAMAITLKFIQPSGRDGGNPRDPSLVPEILGGKRDKALAAMAEEFKRTRRPIFVNLGSEANGSLFITPEQSVAAFRYVHERWRRLGVTNVAYVWKPCPGIWRPGVGLVNGNYEDFYPGDDYVDWIASGYYGGDPETARHTGGLKTFYSLSQMARRRGKPFMIAESGPFSGTVGTGGRQTWDSWFRPYFEDIRRFGVRAVVYNNFGVLPDAPKWGEQRIARMERPIQEAWGREMKEPIYLGASPGLYASLGFDGGTAGGSGQAQDGRVTRPAVGSARDESKHGAVRIRRIALSLDEGGVGELLVDTRTENPAVAEEPAGTMALAGVPNARVVPKGGNSYKITHVFKEHEGASDVALLAGVVPLKQEGLSIDREAGTLTLTPALRDGRPGTTAKMSYPRLLLPPVSITIDVAEFQRGTLVLSFKPQAPSGRVTGTFAVNVSPRFGPDDATMMSAAWRPDVGGKPGEWMNLLEQGVQSDKLIKRGFRLPTGSVSGEHRIPPEVGVAGSEPVSLGRLEVEGVVVPMIGVGFDQGDGGAKVTSVSPGSPAEKAGLESGDVVTAIDGKGIAKFAEALSRVGMARIGQEMRFKVRRDGREKEVVIKPE